MTFRRSATASSAATSPSSPMVGASSARGPCTSSPGSRRAASTDSTCG